MFESICVRPSLDDSPNGRFDLGFLAESMVFYDKVEVIADAAILAQLLDAMGPTLLLELLTAGHLKITYLEDFLGIQTINVGSPAERHEVATGRLPKLELQHIAPELFKKATGREGNGRRLAASFQSKVDVLRYDHSLLALAREDFANQQYVDRAVKSLLKQQAPEYVQPDPIRFVVTRDAGGLGGLAVSTNIDFQKANESYHRHVPQAHSSLSNSHLLALMVHSQGDMFFAARGLSEISSSELNELLLKAKVETLPSSRRATSEAEISAFQDLVFNDARALREAINTKARTFADLRNILDAAKTFKEWLRGQKPDASLVKAYFQETIKDSWVDKLPAKTARFSFFTGAGLLLDAMGAGGIGTAAGMALNVADAFFLDKLIKGWKPNQFVAGPLAKFVANGHDDGKEAKPGV